MSREAEGLISEEQTRHLLYLAQHGDAGAREQLAAAHQRLIGSIVSRFLWEGRERDDLYQVGCIGLLKAIDRFDLSLGLCFSTYAVPLIMGEVRRYLRDDGPLTVSRSLKERARLLEKKRRELTAEWGREPELWQLAESCGCSTEQAVAALEAARPPLSINEARPGPERDGQLLSELLAASEPAGPERVEAMLDLQEGLAALPERLLFVINQRYFLDRTQKEVAEMLQVSQVQVSRLEHQALAELKRQLGA